MDDGLCFHMTRDNTYVIGIQISSGLWIKQSQESDIHEVPLSSQIRPNLLKEDQSNPSVFRLFLS